MISLNDFLNLDVATEQFTYGIKTIINLKEFVHLKYNKLSFSLFIRINSPVQPINEETKVEVILKDVETFNEKTIFLGDKREMTNSRYYVLEETEIEEKKVAQKVCDILNKYPLHTAIIN